MINSINSNKSLINGSSGVVKLENYHNTIKSNISNIYPNLPQSLPELEILVAKKAQILNKRLKMNLTKKKKNLARDIVCDFFYDSSDGYQEVKGVWQKEYLKVILDLEKAMNLPEKLYLVVDAGSNTYLLNSAPDDLDLGLTRSGWNKKETKEILMYAEDEIDVVSSGDLSLISNAYVLSQVVVDGDDSSNAMCVSRDDIQYMKEMFDLDFVGNYTDDYSIVHNIGDIFIVMVKRASDDDIQYIINNLKARSISLTDKDDLSDKIDEIIYTVLMHLDRDSITNVCNSLLESKLSYSKKYNSILCSDGEFVNDDYIESNLYSCLRNKNIFELNKIIKDIEGVKLIP